MTLPDSFFDQGWYKNAEKRKNLRKTSRASIKPPRFDNIARIYRNANDAQKKAIVEKIKEAPEPLRDRMLKALDTVPFGSK